MVINSEIDNVPHAVGSLRQFFFSQTTDNREVYPKTSRRKTFILPLFLEDVNPILSLKCRYPFFDPLITDGPLGCFQHLAVVNNAAGCYERWGAQVFLSW